MTPIRIYLNHRDLRFMECCSSVLIRAFLLSLLTLTIFPASGEISLDEGAISQELETLETSGLPEDEQKKAINLLEQARQWLQQAQAAKARRQALETILREAPKRLASLRSQLAHPDQLTQGWPVLDPARPLELLEIQLAEETSALTQAQSDLEKKDQELNELLDATTSDSVKIAEMERQLDEVASELKAPAGAPATSPLERARRLSLQARQIWLLAEREWLQRRQANLAILIELARAERDLLAYQVLARKERVASLRQSVQAAREQKALTGAVKAKLALSTVEPEVKKILNENLELWDELAGIISESKNLDARSEQIERLQDRLKQDYDKLQQAITLAGTDEAIAHLLRARLESLPALTTFRRDEEILHARLKLAIARRFEIEESLEALSNLEGQIASQLARLPPTTSEARRAVLRLQLEEAYQNRLEALKTLQSEYNRYLSRLTDLEGVEKQLYRLVRSYREFIQQKLLWVRHRGIPGSIEHLAITLYQTLNPLALAELGTRLLRRAMDNPLVPGLLVATAALLILLRRKVKQVLTDLSHDTRSIRTDSFFNTLRALMDTVILAAPLPLLLFGLGLWLKRVAADDYQLSALAQGFLLAGRPAAGLGLLRQVCRPEGLAHRHLRWLKVTRELLWRHLRWFTPWTIASAFVVAATGGIKMTEASLFLGRLVYIIWMISAAILIWRLWRRNGPILTQLAASRPSWIVTYHPLWFPAILALPLLMALAALLGYYYAAFYLTEKGFRTLWLFIGLVLLKDFLLRWLYVAERRLRYQEILRRREEQRTQAPDTASPASELPAIEEPQVDFGRLSDQARRLLRIGFFFAGLSGLWMIWQDAVPALTFLETVTLPMTKVKIVGGVPQEVPLNLADMVTGLLLGLVTVLAAKNLPGLLEFAILQRLPMDKGARYAWSAFSQYLIAALGIYVIFSSLGVQWSDIQWLVAALSVGVGFGLQEVVANFISGLILLFERPIRVGDVVTVGNTTGSVSRIRIRATTILNWDRQELIIPNKNFITGEVINWTLSDTVNRLVIQVGIAYGSDAQQAMQLILETAEENPEILNDPKPLVTFENFGDNALGLILRAYLGSMDNRLNTITELHQSIYAKLNAAGIEIAFPQRDVHLDTRQPLEVKIQK